MVKTPRRLSLSLESLEDRLVPAALSAGPAPVNLGPVSQALRALAIIQPPSTAPDTLHAEKNQDIVVENDETHWVAKANRTESVSKDESITIHQNRTESVGKNENITIGAGNNLGKAITADEIIHKIGGTGAVAHLGGLPWDDVTGSPEY